MAKAPGEERKSLAQVLRYFGDRRVLVMVGLGFSAGLPFILVFDTLSAWLREAGLTLEVISFFSLATIASSLKFLWAPLIDRASIPWLTPILGHRRSWMLIAQGAIAIGLWLIAGSNPANNLMLVALFAVFTGFSSATQDIVIDAWRIEAAEEERQGIMAAAYQWGYRIATLVAGALALVLAQSYGWALSYTVMSLLMAIGVASVLFAPREKAHQIRHVHTEGIDHRPWLERAEWLVRIVVLVIGGLCFGTGLSGKAAPVGLFLGADLQELLSAALALNPLGIVLQVSFVILGAAVVALAAIPFPYVATRPGAFLSHIFGDPLIDFWRRHRQSAGLILALICVYRLSENVLNIMPPFYLDAGFSLIEIAEVRKIFGMFATLLGATAGGILVARRGLMPAMVIGAFAQPVSHAGFIWLATQGHHMPALFIAIGLDNVASGFAGTALIAYMSSLTSAGFTATQYALFSSLYSLLGKIIASQSGRIVESSARDVHSDGMLGFLRNLLHGLPPDAYAAGAAKIGVRPEALGAGYIVFFLYSGLIGIAGIVLAFIVARRERSAAGPAPPVQAS